MWIVSICKKWGCFIALFWRNSWFKNPAIWLAESIFEQDFSHIQDLCRNTANMNFHYRTNWLKINDQIFLLIQKTLFLAHFPNFLGKKGFSKKSGSVRHIAPCQNSEKSNDPALKNHPDRRQDGTTDRRYFIGPFQLLLQV